MRRQILIACSAAAAMWAAPVAAQTLDQLREQDRRLASAASRLLQSNARFCDRIMPDLGLVLHSKDQYPAQTADGFPDSNLAISAVSPDSAAEGAGLKAGDQILAIGPTSVADLQPDGDRPARDIAFGILADQAGDNPLAMTLSRDGRPFEVMVTARPACRLLVEITTESGFAARTDGKVMQVTYSLASSVSDEQLAAIVAHELGHVVLRHRARLEAAGVAGGLLREFGQSRALSRDAEIAADRMSVHLLANAGFDPLAAVRFWESPISDRVSGGLFRSGIYPSNSARIAMLQDEVARFLPYGPAPDYPGHLLADREKTP